MSWWQIALTVGGFAGALLAAYAIGYREGKTSGWVDGWLHCRSTVRLEVERLRGERQKWQGGA